MKPFILAAAVAAFEFSFLVSVATLPDPSAVAAQARSAPPHGLAQRAAGPVPCTPQG
jgi:hypothetical protein